MKHTFLKLLTITLLISLTACKKEATLSEFKYSDKGIVLNCDKFDLKLLNEALFSFENDIIDAYGKEQKNITTAYSQFVNNSIYNRIKYEEITSAHTLEIFNVLKSKPELWNLSSSKSKLNYNSPVFNCIASNILNKDLKTTLNALITTNSMSLKLFAPAVRSATSSAVKDKYLATYIAFDLFYAKLFDIDTTKIKTNTPEKAVANSQAGHNQ